MALSDFRERPLNALLTSLPLGWRGLWGFRSKTMPGIILNFLAYLSMFISPLIALYERRLSWLLVSVVPISYFLFYSFFSHFLPRYSTPLVPTAIICLSMVVVDLAERLWIRFGPDQSAPLRLR